MERDRIRPTDKAQVPSSQMTTLAPALTWEESMGAMLLYVEDCDAAFKRAVEAGCASTQEPKDEFWGDRFAKVTDPFGHQWTVSTHVEDVSPEEMDRRMAEMQKKGGSCG